VADRAAPANRTFRTGPATALEAKLGLIEQVDLFVQRFHRISQLGDVDVQGLLFFSH
jgi:hypothetical protein